MLLPRAEHKGLKVCSSVSLSLCPLTYKGGLAQEASMDADAAAGVRLLYDGALLPVPSIEKQVQ